MCSPWQLRPLVVGFLYLEGLIESIDDLEMVRVCLEDRLADVRLANGFPDVPPRKILTSGCTGGVSFGKYLDQIEQFRVADDDARASRPSRMYSLLRALYDQSNLYQPVGRRAHVDLRRAPTARRRAWSPKTSVATTPSTNCRAWRCSTTSRPAAD